MLLLVLACGPSSPDLGDDSSPVDPGGTPAVDHTRTSLDEDFASLIRVEWEQGAAGSAWVEYREGGGEWASTPAREREAGAASQLVVGVPYATDVELRVAVEGGDGPVYGETVTQATGPLPEGAPQAGQVEGDPAAWDPGTAYVLLSLADSDFGSWYLVVDREARVVWALESPNRRISLHPRVSLDGRDLLLDENSYWAAFDGGVASRVVRMKLDGTVVETMDTPGLHHPFTDLPDGSLVYTAMGLGTGSETLDRRWPDGTIETVWDCQALADAVGDDIDYCGSNTVWYDPDTGHVLNSIYSTETIVEVDLEAGEAVRWFGHTTGAWSFDPPESAFWWQHGGYITEAGTLLTSSKGTDSARETVVREYAFDEARQALVEVWSFGEGEGVYGDVMGEAHRLGNGNTLHNYGSATRLREVTPEGVVVWDVNWRASTMGRSTPIGDLYALAE